MDTIGILGFSAAILTTLSFVPQVYKTLSTKSTAGISLVMYSLFVVGVTGWLLYGILRFDLPVIIANAITSALAAIVLVYKIVNVLKKGEKP